MFGNGGRAEWYIGSADLMERNLDRRVEVVTPVEDHEAQARLARIIEVMLADDRRSWQLAAGRRLDPDRGPPVGRGHDRHLRRAQGGRRDGGRARRPSPPVRRRGRRLDGSARVTDGIAAAAARGRAQVPDERRRRPASGCSRPTSSPGFAATGAGDDVRPRGPLPRHRRCRARRRRLRGPPPVAPAAGTIISLKGLKRQDDGGRHASPRGARGPGRSRPRRPRRVAGEPRPATWCRRSPAIGRSRTSSSSGSCGGSGCTRRNGTVVELSARRRRGRLGWPASSERFAELEAGAARGRRGDARAAGRAARRDRGAGAVRVVEARPRIEACAASVRPSRRQRRVRRGASVELDDARGQPSDDGVAIRPSPRSRRSCRRARRAGRGAGRGRRARQATTGIRSRRAPRTTSPSRRRSRARPQATAEAPQAP